MSFLARVTGPVFIVLCVRYGLFQTVYLYLLFLLPPLFFEKALLLPLNKVRGKNEYALAHICSFLLLTLLLSFLSFTPLPFPKSIFFLAFALIQCLFFVYDTAYFYPNVYQYLKDIGCVAYIKSKVIKMGCLVLGVIMSIFMAYVFQEMPSFWIILPILAGFISPFALACLIKARFRPSVIKQLFVLPPHVSEPSKPVYRGQFFFWLTPKLLVQTARKMRQAPWYEQVKYAPFALTIFYLIFIFPFDMGSSVESCPFLGFLMIVIGVLMIISLIGIKLSFVTAPFNFILILLLLIGTGGTFGILELIFSLLVIGSSLTNWRLSSLR